MVNCVYMKLVKNVFERDKLLYDIFQKYYISIELSSYDNKTVLLELNPWPWLHYTQHTLF